jgi:membrane-associated phospholipid phosphatase
VIIQRRSRYVAAWLLQYALLLALYLAINARMAGRGSPLFMLDLERHIPFVPAAYPAYAAIYLVAAAPIWLCRSRREYLTLQLACLTASFGAFVSFLFLPMPYPRPTLEPHTLCESLLAWEWSIDRSCSTFPSLHVAFAWLMALGLAPRRWAPRWLWLLFACVVSLATLLVKQHFLADVVMGFLAAYGSLRVAPRLYEALAGAQLTRRH